MDKIIGMGNALVDELVRIEDDAVLEQLHLPKGSMQLIDEHEQLLVRERLADKKWVRSVGGCAGNTVMALAHLGASVGFIGKTGEDDASKYFERRLRRLGVELHLLKGTVPSGIAMTLVSPDGERTFGTCLGAAGTLAATELGADQLAGYSYLYIEGYLVQDHALMERAMHLARQQGLQICLDLASYNLVEAERDFFGMLVSKYVDIVFANEQEARALTGGEPLEALEEIGSQCSVAVITLGSKGALVKKGTEVLQVLPCGATKAVDTTGAGDFFAAGFLYALSCGSSLEKCAMAGSILADYVIRRVGTLLTKQKWDEIKLNVEHVLQA